MAKSNTSFKPGQSGNPRGRPRKGFALAELLKKELDAQKNGRARKEQLVAVLIDLALKKDIRAIKMIWDVLINDYQFHKKMEIEERIENLERIVEDE